MTLIIDATNSRLGRMATHAAKAALQGQNVVIINCEKAVLTGKKASIVAEYTLMRQVGRPTKGPFLPRMPDRFVRRAVRGMLPYKSAHGTIAFRRVMCYTGIPEAFQGEKTVQLENRPAVSAMSVGELCNLLGGKR